MSFSAWRIFFFGAVIRPRSSLCIVEMVLPGGLLCQAHALIVTICTNMLDFEVFVFPQLAHEGFVMGRWVTGGCGRRERPPLNIPSAALVIAADARARGPPQWWLGEWPERWRRLPRQ